MYKVEVEVRKSDIDGRGVFALADISEGEIVWQYTEGHDKKMTKQDFEALSSQEKEALQRVAYLSEHSSMWVIPPEDDPACFTNHSKSANTKSIFKPETSDEPVFIASRDIKSGEEITDNYLEFDSNTNANSNTWV